MTKQEFLNQLEECLSGQIPGSDLADTLSYYREYFQEEVAAGKTEEEILTSLGSPRLIAHSIIDASEEAGNDEKSGYYDADEEVYRTEGEITPADRAKALAVRAGIIALIIVLLVAGILVLNALLPVILVVMAGIGIYKFFTTN